MCFTRHAETLFVIACHSLQPFRWKAHYFAFAWALPHQPVVYRTIATAAINSRNMTTFSFVRSTMHLSRNYVVHGTFHLWSSRSTRVLIEYMQLRSSMHTAFTKYAYHVRMRLNIRIAAGTCSQLLIKACPRSKTELSLPEEFGPNGPR